MARNLPSFSVELEYLEFPGKVELVETLAQTETACQNLNKLCNERQESAPLPLGFDCEWPVDPFRGPLPTSLIQLCPNEHICYLFHLPSLGNSIPLPLKRVLLAPKFLKVGLAIEADFWKLHKDYDIPALHIIRKCCTDVSQLARTVLPPSKEQWSLDGLCRHVLRKKLNKDDDIRKGDWHGHLNREQIDYAAVDAYASLLVYQKIKQIQAINSQ